MFQGQKSFNSAVVTRYKLSDVCSSLNVTKAKLRF